MGVQDVTKFREIFCERAFGLNGEVMHEGFCE
jgi:hypothetical protein